MVKNRRLNSPSQVRLLMSEQINILRNDDSLDPIEKARAIAYLSNVLLSAYKDGEAMQKIEEIQKHLEDMEK